MHTFSTAVALALALALGGCDGTASVTFDAAADLLVSADGFDVPANFVDGDPPTIVTITCGGDAECPAGPVRCVAGRCDPDPLTVVLPVGEIVDLAPLTRELDMLVRRVTAYEVVAATVGVRRNSLTVDLAPTDVFWGPASATTVGADTRLFGTLPALAAGSTAGGAVSVDAGGAGALSTYLIEEAEQFRLFATPSTDLAPGDAVPAGELDLDVTFSLRVTGQLL